MQIPDKEEKTNAYFQRKIEHETETVAGFTFCYRHGSDYDSFGHTAALVFTDGSVETEFTIIPADVTPDPKDPNGKTPDTGDNSNPALWLLLGSVSFVLLGGLIITERKRKRRSTAE